MKFLILIMEFLMLLLGKHHIIIVMVAIYVGIKVESYYEGLIYMGITVFVFFLLFYWLHYNTNKLVKSTGQNAIDAYDSVFGKGTNAQESKFNAFPTLSRLLVFSLTVYSLVKIIKWLV